MGESAPRRLGALVFPGYELLDVFGPLEMCGNLPGVVEVVTVAQRAGAVPSAQGSTAAVAYGFEDCPPLDLLIVPGGVGTARRWTTQSASTGARASGRGRRGGDDRVYRRGAVGAHRSARRPARDDEQDVLQCVTEQGRRVRWVREARWVVDGPFTPSSDVTAGMDTALAVIAGLFDRQEAERLAMRAEYG
ncbi:MAG: DJ-1/PfpI family protein [Candidatus Binatia bacterium]